MPVAADVNSIEQSHEDDGLRQEISEYLGVLVDGFRMPYGPPADAPADEGALAHEIFSLLTSRAFCYLSRKRVEPYREQIVASLVRRVSAGEPFRFFYDIGPGYHATTQPGKAPLRFDIGLSELLILAQVHEVCRRIRQLYAPGAKFWFVVDNLCALRTNDIALEWTARYVDQFRQLINTIELERTVELIVEAETFELAEYDRLLQRTVPAAEVAEPSPAAIENVARFLGRPCTAAEAAERIELYARTSAVTDQLIDRLVRDVHMTQRATAATLGFRPFPGGDQRTQSGELVLTRGRREQLKPLLITTRNVRCYRYTRFELSEILPPPIPYVLFATEQ